MLETFGFNRNINFEIQVVPSIYRTRLASGRKLRAGFQPGYNTLSLHGAMASHNHQQGQVWNPPLLFGSSTILITLFIATRRFLMGERLPRASETLNGPQYFF
jgi:hypothetical protein